MNKIESTPFELSETLRRCTSMIQRVCQGRCDGEDYRDASGVDLIPILLDAVGGHLRRIHGYPSSLIQPYIEQVNEANVEAGRPPYAIDGGRFFSLHEAALQTTQKLYFALGSAASLMKSVRMHLDSGERFERSDFESDIDDIVEALRSQPSIPWVDIDHGIRREQYLMKWKADDQAVEPPSGAGGKETTGKSPSGAGGETLYAYQKAYRVFLYAAEKLERKPEELQDRDAWEYLKGHGIEGDDELDGYTLPLFKTFTDYLTRARSELGEQKKLPRTGRVGRSIVKPSEI